MPHFVFLKYPLVQQTAKLHDTQASLWCLTDCKSPKEAVPNLSSYSKNSYSISSWCLLQQCDGCAGTPTGAYGTLFTPAASWSLFPASLVCSCRPGGLSSAARRAGRRAAQCRSHTSLLLRGMHLESTLLNQYHTETNMLWSHEEFDVFLQLIISQLSLTRIHRNLSPSLSHEMPLWHKTSCTNQGAGISPGRGFDKPEEWSLQSSGWHYAPHRCACISWVFSGLMLMNINVKSGPEQVTFINAPLSVVELVQGRGIESACLFCCTWNVLFCLNIGLFCVFFKLQNCLCF